MVKSKTLETELFGREVSFDYSEHWLGYSILGLRFLMAWVFIQAGLTKIIDDIWGDGWTSVHFLEGVAGANPFAELFYFFAQYPGVVDPLVMYGQLLIGIALLLGAFFRLAALGGALQMLSFWLASFEAGFTAGLPVEHGFVVNDTLVYAILLFGLGAWGAGRILGVDRGIEDTDIVENNRWLRYLLG